MGSNGEPFTSTIRRRLEHLVDLAAVKGLLSALEKGLSESALVERLERLTRPG
ncbi:MAG: hypothetical protein JNM69_32270 [Archangium sp.]|nr:hypothetical protein [Archangium sp.]